MLRARQHAGWHHDDGSSDPTAEVAALAGAEVLRRRGGGKGAALKMGFESLNGDVVIFTNDVDRQQDSTIGLNPTVYDSDHRVHRDL